MPENSCTFCRIVAGLTDDQIVWEDDKFIAILDFAPNTEAFLVVLPKEHHGSNVFEVPQDVRNGLMDAVTTINAIVTTAYPDVERCAVVFEGYGIFHLHAKIIPMHGTRDPITGELIVIRSQNQTFYETYPGYVASHASLPADPAELEHVGDKLRTSAATLATA